MQSRAGWYLRRLAAMSPPEIATRAWHAALRHRDARRPAPQAALDPPRNSFPGLAQAAAALPLQTEWRAAYEAARTGRLSWFGATWNGADPPDWHLDPLSGRRWPLSFGPAIPYRHAPLYGPVYGDVKCTWELNRLQYLQPIAALAHATGEAAPADLVRRHVAAWIDANPPWSGINWASGIELALRAISLLLVAALVPPGPDLGPRLASSLAAHAIWLARYPSRYSSANNHAVAEALGLLAIGTALPHHKHGARWVARGRRVLAHEAAHQVLPDGSGAEQALGYHCFTLEMLAMARLLGADVGDLGPASRFLRAVTGPGGQAPGIGDDDESRVVWSPPGPERYALAMQPVLGAAPVAPVRPHLRHALFGNPGPAARARPGFEHYAQGGLSVIHDDGLHLVFDHGPLGYLSIAAHGHADALSIWLELDGEPLLVDAGTYRYHGADAMRDTLRGTPAHNTLAVAGADQSRIAGPFNWSHKARCRVVALDPAARAVTAEHDGYAGRHGCIHRRAVQATADGFTITDRLLGQGGPWPVSVAFLAAPGMPIEGAASDWRIGPRVHVHHDGPLQGAAEDAVIAPAMGRLATTRRLLFRGTMTASDTATFTFRVA